MFTLGQCSGPGCLLSPGVLWFSGCRLPFTLPLHKAFLVSRRAGSPDHGYFCRVLSAMLSRLVPDGRLSCGLPARPCAAVHPMDGMHAPGRVTVMHEVYNTRTTSLQHI